MKLVYKILIGFIIIISITLLVCLIKSAEKGKKFNIEDKLIKNMEVKYPLYRINCPVMTQKNEGNNFDGLGEFEFYSFKGGLKDTIVNLSFYFYLEDSLFRIDKYSKKYQDDDFYYHLLMGTDTLFFYKEEKQNHYNKIFFKGEYNYRFMNQMFTPDEMDYYMEHKDSLGKVDGNNLPKFPDARSMSE